MTTEEEARFDVMLEVREWELDNALNAFGDWCGHYGYAFTKLLVMRFDNARLVDMGWLSN
jgi:hypothetical protein